MTARLCALHAQRRRCLEPSTLVDSMSQPAALCNFRMSSRGGADPTSMAGCPRACSAVTTGVALKVPLAGSLRFHLQMPASLGRSIRVSPAASSGPSGHWQLRAWTDSDSAEVQVSARGRRDSRARECRLRRSLAPMAPNRALAAPRRGSQAQCAVGLCQCQGPCHPKSLRPGLH